MFDFNIDLIKKYDRPGPRYTSYPTAPHFHEGYTASEYKKEVELTNKEKGNRDLSLYYHLPFCDTLCYFCGCNMIITRNRDRVSKYIDYLKKEIAIYRELIHDDRKAIQLHWGGGTPTHLNPAEITELLGAITSNFQFQPDVEASCEIDPRGLTRGHLEALRNGGMNRISMGVQDFNPQVQEAVNRIQPEDMTRQVIEWARELKFESINLDLIYGLPFQTTEEFAKTVDRIIDINPDRLAVFNYAHVPWMKKHMNLINTEDLPTPDVKLDILKMTIEKLTDAGYVFIGMDHFAKPDDELAKALNEKKLYRNFQGYSTHAGTDIYAMGITSISQLERTYTQNIKNEKEYFAALDEGILPITKGYLLNDDDLLRRHVITKIMCDFELDYTIIEEQFNINFREYFANGIEGLKEFEDDGLVTKTDSGFTVSELGRLLIRNIAMNFDGFIERKIDAGKYSRTV